MENLLYTLDKAAMVITAIQSGAVLAISALVIVYYARHRSMAHIALVALSHVILTVLVSGAVVFQIFNNPATRYIGIIFTIIAFTLSDISLWVVWNNRREVQEIKELAVINARLDRESARLAELERHVADEPHEVTLATSEIVRVEIVEPKDEDE